jgi:hypothetical protein
MFIDTGFLKTTSGTVFNRDFTLKKSNFSQLVATLKVGRAMTSILIFTDQSVTGG